MINLQTKIALAAAALLFAKPSWAAVYDNMPDASSDGVQAVVNWSNGLTEIGKAEYKQRFGGGATWHASPSTEDWADFSVYQIFPDRFNNGNSGNDKANIPNTQRSQENDGNLYDVHIFRHGGDLQGITNRLDYLAGMGVKILYITSFLENNNGDYHGYCVSNPLKIDPGFGSLEDLQTLVKEAHNRGLYVVMDFVVNHMCDPSTGYSYNVEGDNQRQCLANRLRQSQDGTSGSVPGEGSLNFGQNFFRPMKHNTFFSRCGSGDFDPATDSVQFKDFRKKMFDYDTNSLDLHAVLTNIAKYWIAAADVDGFRLDALKHVTESFNAYFSTQVRDFATEIGKKNFYSVGEILDNDSKILRFVGGMYLSPTNPENGNQNVHPGTQRMIIDLKDTYLKQEVQKFPGVTSAFDVSHSSNARHKFRGENEDLQGYFNNGGRAFLREHTNANLLWQFSASHDEERFLQNLAGGDIRRNSGAASAIQAYSHLSEAMPIVYYGEEQGFNGNCFWNTMDVGNVYALDKIRQVCANQGNFGDFDSTFRQTMWQGGGFSLSGAFKHIQDRTRIARPGSSNPHHWTSDPFLDQTNIIYKAVQRFSFLRASCHPLGRGTQWFRDTPNQNLVAFGRLYQGKEIVVVINPQGNTQSVPDLIVDSGLHSTRQQYRNVLVQSTETFEASYTSGGNAATIKLKNMQLGGYQVAVLVNVNDVNGNWNPTLNAYMCTDAKRAAANANEDSSDEATDEQNARDSTIAAVASATALVGFAAVATVYYRRPRRASAGDEDSKTSGGAKMVPTFADL